MRRPLSKAQLRRELRCQGRTLVGKRCKLPGSPRLLVGGRAGWLCVAHTRKENYRLARLGVGASPPGRDG